LRVPQDLGLLCDRIVQIEMSLTAEEKLAPYEILALIGVGSVLGTPSFCIITFTYL
jgi:hypothetical protein